MDVFLLRYLWLVYLTGPSMRLEKGEGGKLRGGKFTTSQPLTTNVQLKRLF